LDQFFFGVRLFGRCGWNSLPVAHDANATGRGIKAGFRLSYRFRRALRGALHLRHVALRFTLRSNSLSPIFNSSDKFTCLPFEIRNCSLRKLLKRVLALSFPLPRFLIK